MKKLLVASVYGPSDLNLTLRNLQWRYLDRTIGPSNYDHLVWLNRVPEELFQGTKAIVVKGSEEQKPMLLEHLHSLEGIMEQVRGARYRYEHFLVLDSDAFPFRDRWLEKLLAMMQPRSWAYNPYGGEGGQVGVPERRLAAVIRAENLDVFYHPSAVFIRGDALREDPSCVEFRVENFRNMAGLEFPEIAMASKMPVLPLMRSNYWSPHPLLANVYSDLVYHHGAGSRTPRFRALALGLVDHFIPPGAHGELQAQLTAALAADPDSFLRHLTGEDRFRS